ncbi:MAG: arsenite methyltransferase [Candidatus Aminicenantes bacterium]|nr:arsenite methyltransferase [Candidatus Aminicenantes bacterium]
MKKKEIKKIVREGYSRIATQGSSCCEPLEPCCETDTSENISKKIGYTSEELGQVPKDSNLGLGCGNPVALSSLREGEVVLDLGAGAGFDCFLASARVGERGKVIGVDMTPEMIEKARKNASRGNYKNVEFKLGDIEDLPIEDDSVDVIISNCVINLSPDKETVFQESFRVLQPGGRMMISDIVLLKELPDFIKNNVEAYVGCLSGAIKKEDYLKLIEKAGFSEIKVIEERFFSLDCITSDSAVKEIYESLETPPEKIKKVETLLASVSVQAVKPDKGKTEQKTSSSK